MAADQLIRRTTRAMSCEAAMAVARSEGCADPLLDRASDRLDELERRWSRFIDDSEISGLNRAGGSPRRCSDDTVELIASMVAGWHATDGCFDPSLLGALVELGYAVSRVDGSAHTSLALGSGYGRCVDQIVIDQASSVVELPPGLMLDPGGIGKGLAADILARELVPADRSGFDGALVEIGGDVRVRGRGPDDGAWTIAVVHPYGAATEFVRLRDGGVATSTTRLRTWSVGGEHRHHLLDPDTGRNTETNVVGCTVIAGTAAWAEVFTKCAFVQGADRALARYETRGLAAQVVTDDGGRSYTSHWKEFAA